MSLPIIIIHKGDGPFLWYIIKQARHFNPDSEIFLIGDSNNIKHGNIVNHCDVEDYMEEAEEFSKYYKHYGPNDYNYELFCIQRWFVLREFMKKKAISECFHIDSDVLLFTDISADQINFKKFDFTINNGRVGHCMFINNLDGMKSFCEFAMDLYKKKSVEELVAFFGEYLAIKDIGGISDMSMLNAYYKNNLESIGDTFKIIDNSIYDHTINSSDGFEMRGNLKKIFFRSNLPYCINIKTKKEVYFKCLHFQGRSKFYIPLYFSEKNLYFYFQTVRIFFREIRKNPYKFFWLSEMIAKKEK